MYHLVVLQGKFYLVIEELSQLFRSLVPIQLWYKYIMGDDPSSSYFLGGILIILYSLCKASTTSLITSMGAVARAEKEAQLKGTNIPFDCCCHYPGREAAAAGDTMCFSCQKHFASPVRGHC